MMNNRYALCGVLALILPLAGCDQKAAHTPPPPDQYAVQPVTQNPIIGADELYSLVSPIALFPDNLLAQVLAASTSPDDVTAAYQWQHEHSTLKGQALALQVEMESWPAAVKSLTTFPDVLAQMATNLQWTRQLGEAYTRQPADVMNAVQTLRARAQQSGALKSTSQQQVQSAPATTHASAAKSVPATAQTITIKPTQPGVVYVPVYPQAVYGNPPVIYYPGYVPPPSYSSADMVATGLISFTAGVMVGATMDNNWGWNCWGMHWGGSPTVIYNNRTFVNRTVVDAHPAFRQPVFAPGPVRAPHFSSVHNTFAPTHVASFNGTRVNTPAFNTPHFHQQPHALNAVHRLQMAPGPVRLSPEQQHRLDRQAAQMPHLAATSSHFTLPQHAEQGLLASVRSDDRFGGHFAFRRR